MTPAATCKGSSIDVDPSGGLLYAGMNDGTLQIADPRASSIGGARRSTAARAMSLHEKKIAHVHLNPAKPHLLATSNDLTVAVWDVRMLSGKGGPKKKDPRKLASGKSVTSAYWSPVTGNKLLTTCKDDRLRIWNLEAAADFAKPKPRFQIRHNNNTGRWLTAFKAVWQPGSEERFGYGSMERPRGIDFFSASKGTPVHRLSNPDVQGAISSLHAFHPTKLVLAGGNSSGRVYLWSA